MLSQGWTIVDRYKNTTRDNMPNDETISSFADRLVDLAEGVIIENGGFRTYTMGHPQYPINTENPKNIYALPKPEEQVIQLKNELGESIRQELTNPSSSQNLARAGYMAICLGIAPSFKEENPAHWEKAVNALEEHWNVVQAIYFYCPFPAGERLRDKARAAGLMKPEQQKRLW